MIIVPVTGPAANDAATQLASSAPFADLFELRLDLLTNPDFVQLVASARKPVIATCRPVREGGTFEGSEEERFAMLQRAIDAGARYVDLELDAWANGRRNLKQQQIRLQWIVSHHVLNDYPRHIGALYRSLRTTGADILKLAYMADDAWQIDAAIRFLSLARADGKRAMAIAMGEAGEPSRILYRVLGAWATFAGSEDGRVSAPGQLPASVMKQVFSAHRRTPRTRVFGLVGNPVAQSKGIYIHNPIYRRLGRDAIYCRFRVRDLRRFMKAIDGVLQGCSVTTPHKEGIRKFLRRMDPMARTLGAVNTVVRRHEGYFGANTDAHGALDAIEERMNVRGRRLVVIGAGGAARAIAGEAARRGAEVILSNRTLRKAQRVARAFGVRSAPLDRIGSLHPEILANATSVGMWPDVEASPVSTIPDSVRLAFDAIYNPPMTAFLRNAKSMGAITVTGVEMYTRQAVEQIRILIGRKPDASAVRRLFLSAMRYRAPATRKKLSGN